MRKSIIIESITLIIQSSINVKGDKNDKNKILDIF